MLEGFCDHWDQKHWLFECCSNFHQRQGVYVTAHAQLDWGLVRRGVEEEEEGQGSHLLDSNKRNHELWLRARLSL